MLGLTREVISVLVLGDWIMSFVVWLATRPAQETALHKGPTASLGSEEYNVLCVYNVYNVYICVYNIVCMRA